MTRDVQPAPGVEPRGAVFFDIDGTLVPDTTSARHLARRLGHLAAVAVAEQRYADGELSNQEVSEIDALGWKGRSVGEIAELLADLPLVDGIPETVDWCVRNGLRVALATVAWAPVGRHLIDQFGFESTCGPVLEVVDGRYTGSVAVHFDEFDKRAYALDQLRRWGLPADSCAAIGDSRSDLPLFEVVGYRVGFNATPAVRAAADTTATGRDISVVVPLLRGWLEQRFPAGHEPAPAGTVSR